MKAILILAMTLMAITASFAEFITPPKTFSKIAINEVLYDYLRKDFEKTGVTLKKFKVGDSIWKLQWHATLKSLEAAPDRKSSPAVDVSLNLGRIEKKLREIGMPDQFILAPDYFLGAIKHAERDGEVLWFYQFFLMDDGFGNNSEPIHIVIPVTENGTIPVQYIKSEGK